MSHLDRVLAARPDVVAAALVRATVFTRDDLDLIVELAGCSLDESPNKNWVERAGSLPEYICRIARAVKRGGGKTTSQAVAIAVSRVKKWATGAGVNADTQAKAAAALTQWEALKAKNKAKKTVKATNTDRSFLCLAATASYNVDIVRRAFEAREREARRVWREANPNAHYDDGPGHLWVREQWTDFLIVERGYGSESTMYKVPYTVDEQQEVSFADPVEVKTEYVAVEAMAGDEMTDSDVLEMISFTRSTPKPGALDRVLALAAKDDYGDMTAEQMMARAKKMMQSDDEAMRLRGRQMMARAKRMMAKANGD